MPAVTPSKPVLRPPALVAGGVALVAGVLTVAFVANLPRVVGSDVTVGDVVVVVVVGLLALLMLVGVALTLTTRVWVDDGHLHVRALGRHTRRSLRPPATVELVRRRSRGSILPPWRLVLHEPGLAPLAVGSSQVGPIEPLLRLVAPYAEAEPTLPADDFTAASLRDPDSVRRPG